MQVTTGKVRRTVVTMGLAGGLALGASACGGGSKAKTMPPPDPVQMALAAPGVRSVLVPKQSDSLTIVVPPCGLAKIKQETVRTPPGSNQVVVPNSALDQTVSIQPCLQGVQNARGSTSVLLSPGGAGSAPNQQSTQPPPNQLILPKNANISKLIVPPCLVLTSSSSSGGASGSGPNTVLPSTRGKTAVTAPPCTVQMTSSS